MSQLFERHGWAEMGHRIPIRCFLLNPSIKSSLTFLRKTPWARQKVEAWFLAEQWHATNRLPTPAATESGSHQTRPFNHHS